MKKIVTVFALVLISSGAFAQFNQGRMLVGGSVGFSAYSYKNKLTNNTTVTTHSSSFSLAPDAGYFVIDNLAVGASIGFSVGSSKSSSAKTTTTGFSLYPFTRYYLQQVPVFFQVQLGLGTSGFKSKQNNIETSGSSSSFSWDLGAGYAYFLNDFVAIEPMMGYRTIYSNEGDNRTGLFYISAGLQVYLGARN